MVVSTAIRPDNAEVVAARERGIPVVRRAEALAALMAGRRGVCVAGTHGKTSTTSMLTVALQQAGLDPSFAIGGELNESGTGAHHGSGDIFIAEADESDGSFLSFAPHGAIITNLEPDHLDHHGTRRGLRRGVRPVRRPDPARAGSWWPASTTPACRDCCDRLRAPARSRRAPDRRRTAAGRTRTSSSSIRPPAGHGSTAVVRLADGTELALALAVPGAHMVANATAALAAGIELGRRTGR